MCTSLSCLLTATRMMLLINDLSAMGMHHFPNHKVLVLVTNTDAALTTRSASIPSLPTINPDHHLKRHCIERVKNKKTMYHCP